MNGDVKAMNGSLALNPSKVVVIQPTQRQEAQKLRVAAYARVSTDSSDQANSFLAQMEHYNRLIAGNENWTLVDVYADRGISGTSAEKRPDFQRMLSDCRQGRIDKIFVKSISRFARNTKECLEIVRELKTIGIGVCFEEQNIDTGKVTGELLTSVYAAIAQKESESISQNMRWSYRTRMEKGAFLPGSMAYGYRIEDKKIVIQRCSPRYRATKTSWRAPTSFGQSTKSWRRSRAKRRCCWSGKAKTSPPIGAWTRRWNSSTPEHRS